MSLHLLDADSVIDVLKRIVSTQFFIRGLFAQGHTLATTSVVIAEVWSGLHPSDQITGERFLSALVFLPISPQAARQAGEWRYAFARRGQQLATTDCLIAAVAHEHRAAIVTGNVRDFPMPQVTVVPLPRVTGHRP